MTYRIGRLRKVLPLLLAGIIAGSLLVGPASSHMTSNLSHLKKHLNKTYQQKCKSGATLAYAYIDGAAYTDVSPGDPFELVPKAQSWTCNGKRVQVRKIGVGFYDVRIGDKTPCGKYIVQATRAESIGIIRAFTETEGGRCHIDVRTQDTSGSFNEGVFQLTVFRRA